MSICEIYRFVKSDLSGITQQMDSFSEQVDTLQHFEIKFSIDELRNNIPFLCIVVLRFSPIKQLKSYSVAFLSPRS